jgi:hypothetical protein
MVAREDPDAIPMDAATALGSDVATGQSIERLDNAVTESALELSA